MAGKELDVFPVSEMVKRVAKAVLAEYYAVATDAIAKAGGGVGFSHNDETSTRIARAAIEAMRPDFRRCYELGRDDLAAAREHSSPPSSEGASSRDTAKLSSPPQKEPGS